jgi:hypothetical protein
MPIARHTRIAFAVAVHGAAALARCWASARARGLVGSRQNSRHAGSKGKHAEVRQAANDALPGLHHRCVLRTAFESPTASKNMPAHVRSAASNWRARTHRVPSSARVWREMQATPRPSPPTLRAGGLKRDGVGCHNRLPHPYWYVAPSLGRLPRPHPLRAIGKFAECGG